LDNEPLRDQGSEDAQPELTSRLIGRLPFFYGWVVLGAGTIVAALTIPGQTVGVSVFLDSIIDDLDINRSTVSVIYTIGTATGAMSLTYVGRFLDRVGPRVGTAVIGIGFALACVFLGAVQTVFMLTIAFVLLRGFGQGSLGLSAVYAINLWFVRRRGMAIGISGVGFAIVIAIIPATLERLHTTFGWRTSYFILGAVVAGTVVPLALLFRKQPERYGLAPDGPREYKDVAASEFNVEPPTARRTTLFWLFALGTFTTSGLGTGVVFHHFSILATGGVDRADAAIVFIPYGLSGVAFGLMGGMLVDRVPHRFVLAAGQLLMVGILLAAVNLSETWMLWAYGTAQGAMQGMMLAVSSTVYAHEFGRKFLGEIKGTASTISIGGSAVGPLLYGVTYDVSGSYGPTLAWSATIPLGIAMIALFAPPRSPRAEQVTSERVPTV
jgi:sugar phosphate permease